jgi:hypothetical protein
MYDIYASARKVLVWVGEEDSTTQHAIDFISKTANGGHFAEESCSNPGFHDDSNHVDSIGALGSFFSRPYWSRIWTVQEVILGEAVEILCGKTKLAWNEIRRSIIGIRSHFALCCGKNEFCLNCQQSIQLFADTASQVSEAQIDAKTDLKVDLLRLLVKYRERKTTDPRDKAYALLSLASVEDSSKFRPGYAPSAQVEDLYIETAKADIEKSKSLRVMTQTMYNDLELGIPSWVVDWHSVSLKGFMIPITRLVRQTVYSAAEGLKSKLSFLEGNILAESGIWIDTIRTAGKVYFSPELAFDSEVFQNWRELTGVDEVPSMRYISGCAMKEAFGRTLSGDVAIEGAGAVNGSYRRAVPSDVDLFWRWFDQTELPHGPENRATKLRPESTAFISSQKQRLFTTEKGYIGMAPSKAESGDDIIVIAGSNMPIILRKDASKLYRLDSRSVACRTLIGPCYVHGIMDGEAVKNACGVSYTFYVR